MKANTTGSTMQLELASEVGPIVVVCSIELSAPMSPGRISLLSAVGMMYSSASTLSKSFFSLLCPPLLDIGKAFAIVMCTLAVSLFMIDCSILCIVLVLAFA